MAANCGCMQHTWRESRRLLNVNLKGVPIGPVPNDTV